MRGHVAATGLTPVLPLELVISEGVGTRAEQVEAVVDIGFEGEFTLPPGLIRTSGFEELGEVPTVLADGTRRVASSYEARILWHGREVLVEALEAEADPLVGMGLLSGMGLVPSSRLTVEAAPGGAVGIEEMVG